MADIEYSLIMFVSQETSIAQIVDLVETLKLGTVCLPYVVIYKPWKSYLTHE